MEFNSGFKGLILGKTGHLLQYTNIYRRHVETSKLLLGTTRRHLDNGKQPQR